MNDIKVKYKEYFVGICEFNPKNNKIFFQYSPEFIKSGIELSPLLLPLENKVFEFPSEIYSRQTFRGLPPMLADSLPDDFGNKMYQQWLLKNNITQQPLNPLDQLAYIGKCGMGALEYEPDFEIQIVDTEINIEKLSEFAKIVYSKKGDEILSCEDYGNSNSTFLRIGSIAGGARAKALIAINEDMKEIKAGDIFHDGNFKYYIIKFDGLKDRKGIKENGHGILEYIFYKMAIDAGIKMTNCRLFVENGISHFMTERFDRKNGEKIHSQTLCAFAGVDFRQPNIIGYEDIFNILNFLKTDYGEKEQLFIRMVFNVLAFNHDDHTKNFSFIYENNVWKLAPAYDVAFAYAPKNYWLRNHNIRINTKKYNILKEDIFTVAEKFNINEAVKIYNNISEVVKNFTYYAYKHGLTKEKSVVINEFLNNKLL